MANILKQNKILITVLLICAVSLVAILFARHTNKTSISHDINSTFITYNCVSNVKDFRKMASQSTASNIRCEEPRDGCYGYYLLANNLLRAENSSLNSTCEGFSGPFVDVKIDNNGKVLYVN